MVHRMYSRKFRSFSKEKTIRLSNSQSKRFGWHRSSNYSWQLFILLFKYFVLNKVYSFQQTASLELTERIQHTTVHCDLMSYSEEKMDGSSLLNLVYIIFREKILSLLHQYFFISFIPSSFLPCYYIYCTLPYITVKAEGGGGKLHRLMITCCHSHRLHVKIGLFIYRCDLNLG